MPGAGLSPEPAGKARPDRLALKRYWGKPAVRNLGEAMETSASCEARSAPSPYPTSEVAVVRAVHGQCNTRGFCEAGDVERGAVTEGDDQRVTLMQGHDLAHSKALRMCPGPFSPWLALHHATRTGVR